MKLRNLEIKNFRGIKELKWDVFGDMICLIGPGDSTKTTILDAIECALTHRWYLQFTDLDFYQANSSEPIEITMVVTGLPKDLIKEEKFGLYLSFWNAEDGLHEGEKDQDEKALVIRLTVDSSLEPEWSVISGQSENPKQISSKDRELLGVSQIGAYIERDLSWGRNSALTRLTGRDRVGDIPAILAEASRQAREALQKADLKQLQQSAEDLEGAAEHLGVKARSGFRAGMDPNSLNVNLGAITLMDGEIPLRSGGLGSRRLLVMAIHKNYAPEGSIILVDEIENGLEPYRLRNLIRSLRPGAEDTHQVFSTTHSQIAIVEHLADELYTTHANQGVVTVKHVDEGLQDIVRGIPEAFLAKSIIVCEGKTEWGVCRAMDRYWQSQGSEPLACLGIEPIYSPKSGGSEAPKYAVALSVLNYRVAYLGDSDTPLNPTKEFLEENQVKVILWADNLEIERRLCLDLPLEGIRELIELAIELQESEDSVWYSIRHYAEIDPEFFRRDLDELIARNGEPYIRLAIGRAADHYKWFKRPDKGEALGNLLAKHIQHMSGTDTYLKFEQLRLWCDA